jgi:ankyrin repeat protein
MVSSTMKTTRPLPILLLAFILQHSSFILPCLAAEPAPSPPASESSLQSLLRDALFEEEASRDLTKAAAGYEALLAQWDKQRALAASALYRLAEVRRKQDRKADAIKLYQRLVTEFPDIDPHARLSRENLTALGDKGAAAPSAAADPAATATLDASEAATLAMVQKLAVESPDRLTGADFTKACANGWLSVVRFLISKDVSDNGEGLRYAASNGHLAIVRELLTLKPLPAHLTAALTTAVADRRTAVIKVLLEAGAKPDDPERGHSLLADDTLPDDLFDLLLAHKADPKPEWATTSPLYGAAFSAKEERVRRLLDLGADAKTGIVRRVAAKMGEGDFPSGYTPDGYHLANPITPKVGMTPLHAAAYKSEKATAMLLAAGADPNAADEAGWTPLHLAAMRGHDNIVAALLAAGAKVEGSPDWKGRRITPLMLAVSEGKAGSVEALLKAKANPDDPGFANGNTPIAFAGYFSPAELRPRLMKALLDAGADAEPAMDSAHSSIRVPLVRTYRYPKLAEKPAIFLSFAHLGYSAEIAARTGPEVQPASLPTLLLAWHDKSAAYELKGNYPDFSSLRLWRKGPDGKMAETVLPLKAGMDFPSLQWGDVLEFVSKDWNAAPALQEGSSSFTSRLPAETHAILRGGLSARITFKSDGFTKDLTLRGALRTYDPAGSEAPLQSFADTVKLLAGDRPGVVKIERSATRGGGVVEWAAGSGNGRALPEDGDVITFTPDKPDAKNLRVSLRVTGQPGIWYTYGPAQEISLLQFLSEFYRALPQEWVLAGQEKDPAIRAADARSLTAEQAVANLIASGRELPGWPSLHWPDWSGVKVRRVKVDEAAFTEKVRGETVKGTLHNASWGEPESFDLLAAMKALTPESTADEARKFDTILKPGDEVELPLLKDHPDGPWPGLDEAALRLLTKALTARITVTDLDGRFRETTLQWLPPRWLPTAAGVLPIPNGEASSGRVHVIRAREFAESVMPGTYPFQVVRDGQTLYENDRNLYGLVVLRPGDSAVLAQQQQQNTNVVPNIPRPGMGGPPPQMQGGMIPSPSPPSPGPQTPHQRRRVTLPTPQ